MESVGKKLRDARSRLGLTLEQVSAATRISLKNLTAIETDDLPSISSRFHYRSFVKQFAAQVTLDYESIVAEVENAAATMPEPLMPGQLTPDQQNAVIHVKPLKPKRALKLNWIRSVVSFSLAMVACTGIYAKWQNSHASFHVMVGEIRGQLAGLKTRLEPAKPAVQVNARLGATTAGAAPRVEQPKAVEGGFHVQLAAIEKTWLSIVSDGKEVFSGVLDASQTTALDGHESARIRTGNAGGLTFTFNGKQIGVLGPRGQVRTVIFTKDNYKVLPSAPLVAATTFTLAAE
jgi:transcriptional regulator with XRE-family HTH domain